jgi:microcystin degradation protein MlrC
VKRKESFIAELISIKAAIADAMGRPGPVCLLDVGDNVGGGSGADGTALARTFLECSAGPALVCINDPAAVDKAQSVGVGKIVALSIGGKAETLQGPPLLGDFRVCTLHEGRFEEHSPRHGGKTRYDMGPCAVVEHTSGLTVILTSRRTPPFSLGQVLSCNVDPARFQMIVAKGVHAPVAAYREVCRSFIRVNTPGVTSADMSTLPYNLRRRPIFPLEPID